MEEANRHTTCAGKTFFIHSHTTLKAALKAIPGADFCKPAEARAAGLSRRHRRCPPHIAPGGAAIHTDVTNDWWDTYNRPDAPPARSSAGFPGGHRESALAAGRPRTPFCCPANATVDHALHLVLERGFTGGGGGGAFPPPTSRAWATRPRSRAACSRRGAARRGVDGARIVPPDAAVVHACHRGRGGAGQRGGRLPAAAAARRLCSRPSVRSASC